MIPDELDTKRARSLILSEINEIVTALEVAAQMPPLWDATLVLADSNGERMAEVWWDGENEVWLVDFNVRQVP